jgi:hypothetical protein
MEFEIFISFRHSKFLAHFTPDCKCEVALAQVLITPDAKSRKPLTASLQAFNFQYQCILRFCIAKG